MGGRAVSPGAALLRKSRMFSLPKVLPEPAATNLHMANHKSPTMTKAYPQYQSITSPLASREKGDWGIKRSFPLKTTMLTTTPLIRVKGVDTIESITDFESAADHTLSLEKFQELGIAMSVPRGHARSVSAGTADLWQKSVFEEDMDFTAHEGKGAYERRWKFKGPWLARLTEGDFNRYMEKIVRPRRSEFRTILRERLAADITARQAEAAKDGGRPAPPAVEARQITDAQLLDYTRALRHDRALLYAIVSKFLDLAPLGQPVGIVQSLWPGRDKDALAESPYGKSGPPSSHPSAGISYLRTSNIMENHPVYGPQAKRTPTRARVINPRVGPLPAKLGVGGFVANAPSGDNEFNVRYGRLRGQYGNRSTLEGIQHLDTKTRGGAKAYVEPLTASIDPTGKVVLQLRATSSEATLLAKEAVGLTEIYNDKPMFQNMPHAKPEQTRQAREAAEDLQRLDRVAEEITSEAETRRDD